MEQFTQTVAPQTYETPGARIKAHLQEILPAEVYENWAQHFVFESIEEKKVIIGYYGTAPLRTFLKEYKDALRVHVCTVLGREVSVKLLARKRADVKKKPMPAAGTEDTLRPGGRKAKNRRAAKLIVLGLVFLAFMLGVVVIGANYFSNRNFKETFYSVSSLKANNKVRVLQISDLHNASYGKENAKLIDRAQKLKPDLILYTGDCLDAAADSMDATVQLCKALSAVAPSYYIYGNNEAERYYDSSMTQDALDSKFGFNNQNRDGKKVSEQTDALESALAAVGVQVLKNETATVTIGRTQVDIYGVLTSNPSAFWSYAGESYERYLYENADSVKITAMHEPQVYETFESEYWGDVLLCGHTHGGSVRLPFVGPLYTKEGGLLPERSGAYAYGRYEVAGRPLLVSAGLDNQTLLRLNNPPELVIIDINRF